MEDVIAKIEKIADVVHQQMPCGEGGAEVSLNYRSYGPNGLEEMPAAKLWSFDVGGDERTKGHGGGRSPEEAVDDYLAKMREKRNFFVDLMQNMPLGASESRR